MLISHNEYLSLLRFWWVALDSNQNQLGYEPSALTIRPATYGGLGWTQTNDRRVAAYCLSQLSYETMVVITL